MLLNWQKRWLFIEDDLWWWNNLSWKLTIDGRWLLMEDNSWWKMTLDGGQHLLEDTLQWKTIFKMTSNSWQTLEGETELLNWRNSAPTRLYQVQCSTYIWNWTKTRTSQKGKYIFFGILVVSASNKWCNLGYRITYFGQIWIPSILDFRIKYG